MTDVTDEDLVRRIRAGDAAAADLLFERYRPRLQARARRLLHGLVRRKVGESDVLQEALLGAFQSLDAFEDRGPGSFERWLDGIVRFKAGEQVRRYAGTGRRAVGRELSRAADAPDPVPPGRLPTPSLAAVSQEDRDAVARAMARLPDEQRSLLEWVQRSELSFAAIGEATGRSANAVSKAYARAVRTLGDLLAEEKGR